MLAGSRGGHRGGSGTVHFPPGDYLCYSIHLKSNVSLYLEQGARIIGADSPAVGDTNTNAYDQAQPNEWNKFQDFGHSQWHTGLIWGEGVQSKCQAGKLLRHYGVGGLKPSVWGGIYPAAGFSPPRSAPARLS